MSAARTQPSAWSGTGVAGTAVALAIGGCALLAVAGCGDVARSSSGKAPLVAVAVLRSTAGHDVSGRVRFERVGDGLEVHGDVSGLDPGAHAYHVHEYGDCSAPDGSSAGPHFDFRGPSPGKVDRITGNLGELTAGPDGHAESERDVPCARLSGPDSIAGRAVIVHEGGNDPRSPPDGNAGARVACGVIGLVQG